MNDCGHSHEQHELHGCPDIGMPPLSQDKTAMMLGLVPTYGIDNRQIGGIVNRMTTRRGPKPVVEYEGNIYAARSYKTEVPDLSAMSRLDALVWLNQNTCKRGHSTKAPMPNLAGLTLVVR